MIHDTPDLLTERLRALKKLKSTNGTIQIEIPQNNLGDWFLRQWAKWQKKSGSLARRAGDPDDS
jgi:hypothetical protein